MTKEPRPGVELYLTAEAHARVEIDRQLAVAGWAVQDADKVNPGLCYRARVTKTFDPRQGDVYYVALLRYHYNPQTKQPLDCYYWSPDDTWTQYPIGGEFRPVDVPCSFWPEGARDLVKLVSESNGRQALARAIEEAVQAETSEREGGGG